MVPTSHVLSSYSRMDIGPERSQLGNAEVSTFSDFEQSNVRGFNAFMTLHEEPRVKRNKQVLLKVNDRTFSVFYQFQ